MKSIITNTNQSLSKNLNKVFDFQNIAINSHKLVNSINPLENIKNSINNLKTKEMNDIMNVRLSELSKYKLSQFLNREIQQEILTGGDLINAKINNDILSNNFSFNEDKTNNLFLHKRINDFYVMIHFRLQKPNKDRKKITEYNNEILNEQYKAFGTTTGVFQNLTGADFNPDYNEASSEDMMNDGVKSLDEYYPDKNPFYFNINLINKKSETLQYLCYSEETKISVDKVRFFNHEMTKNLSFLKNLKGNKDDWDVMRENRKNQYDDRNKIKKNNLQVESLYNCYGPEFYTLNKNLQEELIKFLYQLNVTSEINNFVRYLAINRERREYVGWLFKIVNFINHNE